MQIFSEKHEKTKKNVVLHLQRNRGKYKKRVYKEVYKKIKEIMGSFSAKMSAVQDKQGKEL